MKFCEMRLNGLECQIFYFRGDNLDKKIEKYVMIEIQMIRKVTGKMVSVRSTITKCHYNFLNISRMSIACRLILLGNRILKYYYNSIFHRIDILNNDQF